MPTLFETIQRWADGQNLLDARDFSQRRSLQLAITYLIQRLRRYDSLADLASGYYADDSLAQRVGEEFEIPSAEISHLRDAAYWQRFMEIRHPEIARRCWSA